MFSAGWWLWDRGKGGQWSKWWVLESAVQGFHITGLPGPCIWCIWPDGHTQLVVSCVFHPKTNHAVFQEDPEGLEFQITELKKTLAKNDFISWWFFFFGCCCLVLVQVTVYSHVSESPKELTERNWEELPLEKSVNERSSGEDQPEIKYFRVTSVQKLLSIY